MLYFLAQALLYIDDVRWGVPYISLIVTLCLSACKFDQGSKPSPLPKLDPWPAGSGKLVAAMSPSSEPSALPSTDVAVPPSEKPIEPSPENDLKTKTSEPNEKEPVDEGKPLDEEPSEDPAIKPILKKEIPLIGCQPLSEADFEKLKKSTLAEASIAQKAGCYLHMKEALIQESLAMIITPKAIAPKEEDKTYCQKGFEKIHTQKGAWVSDAQKVFDFDKNLIENAAISKIRHDLDEADSDYLFRQTRQCRALSLLTASPSEMECEAIVEDEVGDTWRSKPVFLSKSQNVCWLEFSKSNFKHKDLDFRGRVIVGFDFSQDEIFKGFSKARYGIIANEYELEKSKAKTKNLIQVGVIRIDLPAPAE